MCTPLPEPAPPGQSPRPGELCSMKDLKHIRYYESLLEQANNELVQRAKAEGGVAVGYTCYYLPEVLLNCDRAFSVRLRAPNTGSLDIS